jgi:cell division protein FtsB
MTIRIVVVSLLICAIALQWRVWASDHGMREVWRLREQVAAQRNENERLQERNRTMQAEVKDLRGGRIAIEERARTDLGMVGNNETFYQVLPDNKVAAR